jgi:hypothetical protein
MRTAGLLCLFAAGCDGFLAPLALNRAPHGSVAAARRAPPLCVSASASGAGPQISRREALIGLAFAGAMAGAPSPSLAADNVEFAGELAGSDGMGVSVSFSYPATWKLENKPGALLVTDQSRDACGQDPDKCDVGEIIAR